MILKEAENGGYFLTFLAKSAFFVVVFFSFKDAKVVKKTDPRSLKTCKKFVDPDPRSRDCDP